MKSLHEIMNHIMNQYMTVVSSLVPLIMSGVNFTSYFIFVLWNNFYFTFILLCSLKFETKEKLVGKFFFRLTLKWSPEGFTRG